MLIQELGSFYCSPYLKLIAKTKNGIRESDEKSAGCQIFVEKESERGISTPPHPPPLQTITDANKV